MTKKLVIFGTGDIAQLAFYYFSSDTDYEVVGFVVDPDYLNIDTFCERPVTSFEQVVTDYPINSHDLFVALSYSKLNLIRLEKYERARAFGYQLASYVSSRATVLNDGNIGQNCFILEDNTIQPFVTIGNNVTLWSGNHIGHHSFVGDHTFIASHVVVSGGVKIGRQCFIGVNATIRDHVTIHDKCVIGAGVLLLGDAAEDGVYMTPATERSAVPSNRLRRI